jgi:hypothetical protein
VAALASSTARLWASRFNSRSTLRSSAPWFLV